MRTPPVATYRVQLRREFDFDAAAAIVPYLAALGISHLYCSPFMQAAPGSAHGYDVVDPTRISEELGGEAGLGRLDEALRREGMGQLLDIVPNHMSVGSPENRWWGDVLRNGRRSAHADFFDIDWDAPGLEGKLLLPVLGDELDAVVARGELQVAEDDGQCELRYFDHRFPLADSSRATPGPATLALLAEQHYVLEFWRTGLRRVNYRRFFDVATLAALRAELPEVFAATHERALRLVRDGVVDGLRIDHVDGLRDPLQYLRRLADAAPGVWIVVEKILALDEELPEEWPVAGATGYECAARIGELLTDHSGAERVDATYQELTGDALPFPEHSRRARRTVLDQLLSSEVDRLTRAAGAAGIIEATEELSALIASMPVYRVYPRGGEPLGPADAAAVRAARAGAHRDADSDAVTIDQISAVLERGGGDAAVELRARFQQVSAAAMAKGVEDTAFYRHVPLASLNEVGGDPGVLGIDVTRFDELITTTVAHPLGLNATTTHDTKRGEDARIRIATLAEAPGRWAATVRRLFELGAAHRGSQGPSRTAEYLFYETLIAAHPIDTERAVSYMRKAVREAKQETTWLDIDAAYEEDVERFVVGVLDDTAMMAAVTSLLATLTPAWQVSSLTQTLLKLVMPGIPDIYQGSELWDLRLVDPDNRTPVDYDGRRELLRRLDGMDAREIAGAMDEGLPKLHLIRSALALRRRKADDVAAGWRLLPATGPARDHVIAVQRGDGVAAIGVLRPLGLRSTWDGTVIGIGEGRWRNVLDGAEHDGGELLLDAVLAPFPIALLERMT